MLNNVKNQHTGTYITRFGFTNLTTSIYTTFYMAVDSTILAIASDGQVVRSSGFNSAGPPLTFSAVSATKYIDVYSYNGGGITTLYKIGGYLSQIGSTPNVLDLTALPYLTGQQNLTSSYYSAVKCNSASVSIYGAFGQYNGAVDLSLCFAGSITISQCYNSDIIMPNTTSNLTTLNVFEHRLVDKPMTFGNWSNCTSINYSIGGILATSITTTRLDGLPALVTLNGSQSGTRDLTIGTNNFTALTTLNLEKGRLSARAVAWCGGIFTPLTTLLNSATALTSIILGNNGFSEVEQGTIISTIYANIGTRPSSGTRTLTLSSQDSISYYPRCFNNQPGNPVYGPNAPIVTNSTRVTINALITAGWTVNYNKQIYMIASYFSPSVITITYGGDASIDIWGVSSNITITTTDNTKVIAGQYTVISGSDKTWNISPVSGSILLTTGATCLITADA